MIRPIIGHDSNDLITSCWFPVDRPDPRGGDSGCSQLHGGRGRPCHWALWPDLHQQRRGRQQAQLRARVDRGARARDGKNDARFDAPACAGGQVGCRETESCPQYNDDMSEQAPLGDLAQRWAADLMSDLNKLSTSPDRDGAEKTSDSSSGAADLQHDAEGITGASRRAARAEQYTPRKVSGALSDDDEEESCAENTAQRSSTSPPPIPHSLLPALPRPLSPPRMPATPHKLENANLVPVLQSDLGPPDGEEDGCPPQDEIGHLEQQIGSFLAAAVQQREGVKCGSEDIPLAAAEAEGAQQVRDKYERLLTDQQSSIALLELQLAEERQARKLAATVAAAVGALPSVDDLRGSPEDRDVQAARARLEDWRNQKQKSEQGAEQEQPAAETAAPLSEYCCVSRAVIRDSFECLPGSQKIGMFEIGDRIWPVETKLNARSQVRLRVVLGGDYKGGEGWVSLQAMNGPPLFNRVGHNLPAEPLSARQPSESAGRLASQQDRIAEGQELENLQSSVVALSGECETWTRLVEEYGTTQDTQTRTHELHLSEVMSASREEIDGLKEELACSEKMNRELLEETTRKTIELAEQQLRYAELANSLAIANRQNTEHDRRNAQNQAVLVEAELLQKTVGTAVADIAVERRKHEKIVSNCENQLQSSQLHVKNCQQELARLRSQVQALESDRQRLQEGEAEQQQVIGELEAQVKRQSRNIVEISSEADGDKRALKYAEGQAQRQLAAMETKSADLSRILNPLLKQVKVAKQQVSVYQGMQMADKAGEVAAAFTDRLPEVLSSSTGAPAGPVRGAGAAPQLTQLQDMWSTEFLENLANVAVQEMEKSTDHIDTIRAELHIKFKDQLMQVAKLRGSCSRKDQELASMRERCEHNGEELAVSREALAYVKRNCDQVVAERAVLRRQCNELLEQMASWHATATHLTATHRTAAPNVMGEPSSDGAIGRRELDRFRSTAAMSGQAIAGQAEQIDLHIGRIASSLIVPGLPVYSAIYSQCADATRREAALQEDADKMAAACKAKDRQIEASSTLIDHLRDEQTKSRAASAAQEEAMASLTTQEDQLHLCVAHAKRREAALQEDVDKMTAVCSGKDCQIEESTALIEHLREELAKSRATSTRQEEAMAAAAWTRAVSPTSIQPRLERSMPNSLGGHAHIAHPSVIEQLAHSSEALVDLERVLKRSDRLISDVQSLQATVDGERARNKRLEQQLRSRSDDLAMVKSQHAFEIEELSSWADGLLDGFHRTIAAKGLR